MLHILHQLSNHFTKICVSERRSRFKRGQWTWSDRWSLHRKMTSGEWKTSSSPPTWSFAVKSTLHLRWAQHEACNVTVRFEYFHPRRLKRRLTDKDPLKAALVCHLIGFSPCEYFPVQVAVCHLLLCSHRVHMETDTVSEISLVLVLLSHQQNVRCLPVLWSRWLRTQFGFGWKLVSHPVLGFL